jgi:hypothetical protein
MAQFGFKILALGTTLSVFVNSAFQSFALKKDLSLSWKFFFSTRVFKVVGASVGTAIVVHTLLKVEFFSQPFITKCLFLGTQILAICTLYLSFLFILGERSADKVLLEKVTKKLRRR